MEIIKEACTEIKNMAALRCCWPPGVEDMQHPEPD